MRLTFKTPRDYATYFKRLVELERDAEKQFHINEIKRLSGRERERIGRAILRTRAHRAGQLVGGFKLYRFWRADMPDHQINVGDVVLVSVKNPLRDGIEGTVYEKGQSYLTVAFPEDTQLKISKRLFRIDLYINDITFRRMLDTLTLIENGVSNFPIEILLGKGEIQVKEGDFDDEVLNEFQIEAARLAIGSFPVFLIHGPPGTGKTTTLVKIMKALVLKGEKVLATADSNNAVDNIVEGLIREGVQVTRIGHPARLKRELIEVSLDYKVEKHSDYGRLSEINAKIDEIKAHQSKFKKPVPAFRRGLSDEEILKYAKQGRGVRGVSARTIKSMARWIEKQRELNELYEKRDSLVSGIIREILDKTEVICTTNSTAGSDILLDRRFDVVVIDEATQATEPSCLIPLIKARKAIMAGDHKQLPPTILNPDAGALSFTLFERLVRLFPKATYMLRIQYRMNETIMKFPSEKFYNGALIAAESVKDIKLSDLLKSLPRHPALDDTPVVFIDTGGKFLEKTRPGSFSKYNPEEARLVKEIVDKLVEAGLSAEKIGVITPYKDHEDYLKSRIKDVEIHTVDGFQGREKEVIVLSLVRSNPQEEIGFLSDLRRLNVAITRAKRKLIIIGDQSTLSSHPVYQDLLEFIKKSGKMVRV